MKRTITTANVHTQTCNINYLTHLDVDNYNTFIITSGPNTNKTGICIKYITELIEKNRANSIIVPVINELITINLLGRFEEKIYNENKNRPIELGIQLYTDNSNGSRIIVTPSNFINIIKTTDKKIIDILFLDDAELFCTHIFDVIKELDNSMPFVDGLFQYIANAKYVFISDTNIPTHFIEMIKKIRTPDKIIIINNLKKAGTIEEINNYYINHNMKKTIKRMLLDVKNNKKIFIGTDSDQISNMLYKKLITLYPAKLNKIILYNDTNNQNSITIKNPNSTWINYDVIICSNIIICGVKFTVKNYIDTIYGFYKKDILPVHVSKQLERIRYIKSHNLYIYGTIIF